MVDKTHDNEENQVVYEREVALATPGPEFKPGDTPHTQFGDETLNANVPWNEIVQQILEHKTQKQLAEDVGTVSMNVANILSQNYNNLNFRTGAKILTVHCNLYPAQYC